MGKNKGGRASSQKNKKEKAFVVSSIKKAKTKPVSTNLKKMNFQSKVKNAKADESFKDLRKEIVAAAKSSTDKSKQLAKGKQTPKAHRTKEPVDMDVATESFSKL